jgi:hypothetical protein
MADVPFTGCQWLGSEQDPRTDWPVKYCNKRVIGGTAYCEEHYWKVYKKGSATAGRRREKEIDSEIADLRKHQELEEIENVE